MISVHVRDRVRHVNSGMEGEVLDARGPLVAVEWSDGTLEHVPPELLDTPAPMLPCRCCGQLIGQADGYAETGGDRPVVICYACEHSERVGAYEDPFESGEAYRD